MPSANVPSILIVEDDRIVAKDMQQILVELGYDAFAIAASGDEAINRSAQRCPDLVLMDIRLKGHRDGIDTGDILGRRFGVPILYLTAHADDATVERAKKTEPFGYLIKPVTRAELRSAVEVSLYMHQMRKQLRERERWYSTTLRSMADAVIAVDLNGAVTLANPAAETLLGMSSDQIVGRPVQKVMRLLDAQARALSETPLETALREERSVMISELGLVNAATGAVRLIGDNAAPVVDHGMLVGAVMVFRDVTEERKVQKQLELADRLASLGTMAAGVAHEINNPLAVVIANTSYLEYGLKQLLADSTGTATGPTESVRPQVAELGPVLSDLKSAGTRIARIVAELRAFSPPPANTSGRADVIHALEWAIRATRTEVKHRARLTANLGEVPLVKGDESRLGQVFVNLLINAAHAIAPGSAADNEVCVSTRTDRAGRAIIEIRDTGGGIPADVGDRIFEPFFTTKPGTGTGLGLSICHGIVSSFGGEIQVESQVGTGTIFRVVLPPALEEADKQPQSPTGPEPSPALRGRILLIDDEEMVLRAISRILRAHDVVSVKSGAEALALLDAGEHFDLVLSDLVMQRMNGMQLYEVLLQRYPDVARTVIFLSGGAINSTMEDFLRAIPNARLDKPVEVSVLLEAVQRLLSERANQH
jgi:PAS domain S-box-containing protein